MNDQSAACRARPVGKSIETSPTSNRFASRCLVAAGVYNLLWGAWVVLRPNDLFAWLDVAPPTYPAIWQCVGMVVGVYGIGYLIAARDPSRHWPIVLVGLLGKVFGPVGFVFAVVGGDLPAAFGWMLLANDLVWWWPFSYILWRALSDHHAAGQQGEPLSGEALTALFETTKTDTGRSLAGISFGSPVLLVMSRHLGCVFCRQSLADLADALPELIERNVTPVIAYPSRRSAKADEVLAMYGLDAAGCERLPDPHRRVYRALSMHRARFGTMFNARSIAKAVRAWFGRGHAPGEPQGDVFQLPGAALIADGRLVAVHTCTSVDELVNYRAFVDAHHPELHTPPPTDRPAVDDESCSAPAANSSLMNAVVALAMILSAVGVAQAEAPDATADRLMPMHPRRAAFEVRVDRSTQREAMEITRRDADGDARFVLAMGDHRRSLIRRDDGGTLRVIWQEVPGRNMRLVYDPPMTFLPAVMHRGRSDVGEGKVTQIELDSGRRVRTGRYEHRVELLDAEPRRIDGTKVTIQRVATKSVVELGPATITIDAVSDYLPGVGRVAQTMRTSSRALLVFRSESVERLRRLDPDIAAADH